MTKWARRAHALIAWLFVASVIYQVYLIGLYLFAGDTINPHRDWGNSGVFVLALLTVLSALFARLPPAAVGWTALLFVLYLVQWALGLPDMKAQQPYLAALHPVNALAIFILGVSVAKRAWRIALSATALEAAT